MTDTSEQTRQPIDQEFLEIRQKLRSHSQNLTTQEAELIKIWLEKLTGTSPKKRNEYISCLLDQVESGKLLVPFTNIPEKFAELPPLHEALHGPVPDLTAPKTTTWRSGRGKLETLKKLTQKELKNKYGTDRIGLHMCLKDIPDIQELTIQSFLGLAGPHTKDGGALLLEIMQEELQEFRTEVQSFYEQHSSVMADQVAKEQIELKNAFKAEVATLEQKKTSLENEIKTKDPDFDWNQFQNYNKMDVEQKRILQKLRQRAIKQAEKNKKIREVIVQLEERCAGNNSQN